MKIGNIPAAVVMVSAFIPATGALLDVPTYHQPLVVIGVVLLIVLTQQPTRLPSLWSAELVRPLAIAMTLLAVQVMTGRGFTILAGGAYVFLFASLFYGLFRSAESTTADQIQRGISTLYKMMVVAMLIETVILFVDSEHVLVKIMAAANTPKYRPDIQADIPRAFGLWSDGRGLNSLLLGPQSAGMLSLFAMIWFLSLRNLLSTARRSTRWLWLSAVPLICSINGTVMVLLIVAACIYRFVMRPRHLALFMVSLAIGLTGLYIAISRGWFLNRIFRAELVLGATDLQRFGSYGIEMTGMTMIGYYLYAFQNPLILWLGHDWTGRLLGSGASYFQADRTYISGDFGFGADVLLKTGLIWAVVFPWSTWRICVPNLRLDSRPDVDAHVAWQRLSAINALIALLWLFSMSHYNQATGNPAGVMIMALHLSVTAYARFRARQSAPLPAA